MTPSTPLAAVKEDFIAQWAALGQAFGADYALIDRTQTPTPPAGEPVVEAGPWAVYTVGTGE